MIEVVSLRKSFGDVPALTDITFKVEKGQIVGFLGANGAGKTTTMDILCGCIGADSGTARIAGFEISENPIEVKKRIGYLPDEPPLHKEMKVEEFLLYVGQLHGLTKAKSKQRVHELMERLEITDMRNRLIGHLSKGYKQRVGLAHALVHDPDVLILDEPTEGLDPNQIVQIRELIKSLRGQHTILFSSHILSEVESVCDQIVIVDHGRVVEQGTHQQLVSRLESGRQYQLRVRQGASTLVEKLKSLPALSSLALDPENEQTISFRTSDQDQVLDRVAQEVLSGGHGLQELAVKSKKLEDVFFQLTH
ncbi:MAG TPA: ABC transporter ATP-binding protein [Oligoflexus sp.]|uniref:ABC transporter ATP-binding protein n=1 Tax=Oligoflexus sp. TaxID=1971216 RepID=UPI002D53B86A|nr:ABC transporter ATP-binding protein [Oligoflexus sp.]HYX34787.1 ABC transporter ATP-binding protein [Oligoflexus sp.]